MQQYIVYRIVLSLYRYKIKLSIYRVLYRGLFKIYNQIIVPLHIEQYITVS